MLNNYRKKPKLSKSNISKDEMEALCILRKDSNCMGLTADRWVALVVMDKDTYIEKCMTLLSDHRVYLECRGLTKTTHNKVIKQLTDLNKQFRPRLQNLYPKQCTPGDNSPPARFMDFLKSLNKMPHSEP